MEKLNKLGKVISTDVLIVGGGSSGLVAALKAKEGGADVLVIDKFEIGHTGQGTKSGHGLLVMAPEDDKERFMEEQILTNPQGQYLNDQEMLDDLTEGLYTYLYEIEKLGVKLPHNEDGSLYFHKHYPGASSTNCNVDIDFVKDLERSCKKAGVRLMSRVSMSDLLKDGDRVVGALGYNTETLEYYIFRAKAVIVANNGYNHCPGGMFFSTADSLVACYDAGAEFLNAEQCTYVDLSHRNTRTYIYWMQNHIYNGIGENISQKYAPGELEEITPALVSGMIKEIAAGNLPIYADFEKAGMNMGDNMGVLLPKKMEWLMWTGAHSAVPGGKAEVSVDFKTITQSLRVKRDMQTSVAGLYGAGAGCMYGTAYGGWVHGDGIGFAWRSGLKAGTSSAEYVKNVDLGEVDVDFIEKRKADLFAPMTRKKGIDPHDTMRKASLLIMQPKYTIYKTEETMLEFLALMDELKKDVDKFYVPTDVDGPHYIAKVQEVKSTIAIMEIIYSACIARKESRGAHVRLDYPDRDDKNWLKWIIVTKGDDEKPAVNYERIPFERYKYKPEGWTPETII